VVGRFCIALAIGCLFIISQPAHADTTKARSFVEQVAKDALSVIQNDKLNVQSKQQKLERLFIHNIYIDWISRFVLGKHWRKATDDQKERYRVNYRKFLLSNYVSRFREYSGETFYITDTREDGKRKYLVTMEIARPGDKQPIIIDYRVRETNGDYKIFDMVIEGISLIASQRSEFNAVISLDGLFFLIMQLGRKSDPG
jgi:phospholipid transport system substrate-binding protein